MMNRTVGIFQGEDVSLTRFGRDPHLLEQEGVAAGLDADDETQVIVVQIGEVRVLELKASSTTMTGKFRMLLAKVGEETA